MQPKIETITLKKLIGQRVKMTLSHNKTGELWRNFMPRRHEIKNITPDFISMQVFSDDLDFANFTPETEFDKWAAIEVANYDAVPEGMETLDLPGGLYAVFHYKGNPNEGAGIFKYIFFDWIPNSEYEIDNRPHFEVLGEKYKNNHPESEEDIYIPIRPKK